MIQKLGLVVEPELLQDLQQHRPDMITVAAGHGQGERGLVDQLLVVHLGDRDVVAAPEPVLHGPHHAPLVLEGARSPDQERELKNTEHGRHPKLSGTPSTRGGG